MTLRHLPAILAISLVSTVILVVLATQWLEYLDSPVVQVDSNTGKCVRVLSTTGQYSCTDLPKSFRVELVAPKWMREKANED